MSKKSKRQSRNVAASAPRTVTSNGGTSISIGAKMSESQFNPDYSQTIKDLRRIGILAATFFSVLVILSFFLR
jgi:hypothetical protein